MDNNKNQRKNSQAPKRFWIIGVGKFGKIALFRIKAQNPGAVITVVDKKPVCFHDASVTVVRQEGVSWLSAMLDEHAPVDWVIPAIPIHVAKQWLVRKISNYFRAMPVFVPDDWLVKMPHALRGEAGQIYTSHADFICPDDCPEPKERCTCTGLPRAMDLFRLLNRMNIADLVPVVLRSHQLCPGVGGILPQDLFNAFQTILENCHHPLMISTACRCHGVADFIRLEKISSRNASLSQPYP